MASHQHTLPPPASQLPTFALRSPNHPRVRLTPKLPHTHTAALTYTDHTGAVNISFTQSAENTQKDQGVSYVNCLRRRTPHLLSSHLPDHALGGYSLVASTDFPLRGLTATKEKKGVSFFSTSFSSSENIWSLALASFSASSRELSNWCCSSTNNTPCAHTEKNHTGVRQWHRHY